MFPTYDLSQGGPNRGPRRNILRPAEPFYTIQVLFIAGSGNEIFKHPRSIPSGDHFFLENTMILGRRQENPRPIPSEDLFF